MISGGSLKIQIKKITREPCNTGNVTGIDEITGGSLSIQVKLPRKIDATHDQVSQFMQCLSIWIKLYEIGKVIDIDNYKVHKYTIGKGY